MVISPPPTAQGLIHGMKISSVGPAYPTSPDLVHEPGNVDLAMKLHYLRGVYYFRSQAFEGLNILAIKEPMFTWLNKYPATSGRFRRAESGRAYIKCNDCGVRLLEAKCEKTLDEWLEMNDASLEKHLVPHQFIGPELGFSPMIFIQLTKFKCGGTAMGLSWAHVLGDAFAAAEFINMLGRAVSGQDLGKPFQTLTKPTISNGPPKVVEDPTSVKRVDPVGDTWVAPTEFKLEPFSFEVNHAQLGHLESRLGLYGAQISPFEAISAVVWKCIAKVRAQEPNVVTIFKKSEEENKIYGMLSNSQVVGVVKADFSVVEAEASVLASLLKNEVFDDRKNIDEAMERENGVADYIVYGANLSFVNLEDAKFYDFEYRGEKPVRVSYRVDGVGDRGAVVVLPGPNDGGGRVVVAVLPEEEIAGLKLELKKEGLIA